MMIETRVGHRRVRKKLQILFADALVAGLGQAAPTCLRPTIDEESVPPWRHFPRGHCRRLPIYQIP